MICFYEYERERCKGILCGIIPMTHNIVMDPQECYGQEPKCLNVYYKCFYFMGNINFARYKENTMSKKLTVQLKTNMNTPMYVF